MPANFPKGPFAPGISALPLASPSGAGTNSPAAPLSGAFRSALGKAGAADHPAGAEPKTARSARELKAGEDKALKGGKAPPVRLAPRQGHR